MLSLAECMRIDELQSVSVIVHAKYREMLDTKTLKAAEIVVSSNQFACSVGPAMHSRDR